jgi:hypothetical protein
MNSSTSKNKKVEKTLVSKFITQLFEKNYSNANETLENLIEKKLKTKIKKMHDKCSCEKHGNLKKNKKVVKLKENADNFLASKLDDQDFGDFSEPEDTQDRIPNLSEEQPEEEDYIISSSGTLGGRTDVSIYGGKHLATFGDEEDAENFLRKRMDQESFYPKVWFVDDHGGYTLKKL